MFKKIKVREFLEEVCGAKVDWISGNVIKVNEHYIYLDKKKFILNYDWHFYGTKRDILKTLKEYGFVIKKKLQLNYY